MFRVRKIPPERRDDHVRAPPRSPDVANSLDFECDRRVEA